MGLALRVLVHASFVALEHVERGEAGLVRIRQRVGSHEVEVVGRGVVLGVAGIGRARQTAHGEVVSRRAVLALVVAVRSEVHDADRLSRVPEDVRHGAVNLGVPTAAPFVMQVPRVPDTGEHEAVPYPRYDGFVAREPGDRADSSPGSP